MNDKELYDADQKMAQNDENVRYEAQKSQPQSQVYIPPSQPQPYETSQPQSQVYIPPPQPQSQVYIPSPQPQTYETPQPQSQTYIPPPQSQTYQTSEPQTQPQSYQSSQTPYINPPVTNNINQNGSNQSSNYVMSPNPNALLDNYEPFQDGKNAPNRGILAFQLILGIILLLISIISIIDFLKIIYRILSFFSLIIIISNALNIIVGIWMIILSIKKQTTRNNCLGIISLIALIFNIFLLSMYLTVGYSASVGLIIDIIFLIIITSYNMKCQCCECCD